MFMLYMDMVAGFGHVTKLICWNILFLKPMEARYES